MQNISIADFPSIVALSNSKFLDDFNGVSIHAAYFNSSSIGDETDPTSYRCVSFSSPTNEVTVGNGIMVDPDNASQVFVDNASSSFFICGFTVSITAAVAETLTTPSILLQTRTLDKVTGDELSYSNRFRIRGTDWTPAKYNQAFVFGSHYGHLRTSEDDPNFAWSIMASNGIRIYDLWYACIALA